MSTLTEEKQSRLFDVRTRLITPAWQDPTQPLSVPLNPLEYQAHKLQMSINRMEDMMVSNPAQFNATVYNSMLDKFTEICIKINDESRANESGTNEGAMDQDRHSEGSPAMGEGAPARVHLGISATNPFAG